MQPQPQYPAQPPMPQYPQQPQQGYPVQPAYPQQPAYAPPAPQYPPQQGYPQPYGQPQYAPQAPAVPLPTGTLDGYWQQPSASGGPSFKFKDKPIGTHYEGFVTRPVSDSDVRPQTDNNGNVQTYKDGRPKFVMVVPMTVQPTQEFPEGTAGWWVKGQARDELARAMAEAGAPQGAPESGAFIRVTLVGVRQIPGGFNPAFQYRVEYVRPQGAGQAAPAAPAQQPVQAPAQPPMPQQSAPVQQAPAPVAQPQYQQPVPPAPVQQPAPQPAPVAAGAPVAAPAGFTPEQQALLAQLTGQQNATA
jgi:hypothetical protein